LRIFIKMENEYYPPWELHKSICESMTEAEDCFRKDKREVPKNEDGTYDLRRYREIKE